MPDFDVIVVGSGHAGCEAALAVARMGCRVAVITLNIQRTAHMPCNCSIGGPAKGHLVREIDALGGQMGVNIDRTLTHIRHVGTGKGPAVRTLRAHADKALYPAEMLRTLQSQANLTLIEGSVESLIVRDGVCAGVIARLQAGGNNNTQGIELHAAAVVLTTGTFLNGLCHIGEQKIRAARFGDQPSVGLTESLRQLGFRIGRF
ncbi:MAG: tRNA uridine-5-carboxymethylaminomethyl(34) synthesis enzyme MnmG, partial [Armatimonadetes bacterium CP1_7O]